MRRSWKNLVLSLAAAALAISIVVGCGDDEENGNNNGTATVRNGTWSTTTTTSYSGSGNCDPTATATTQDAICGDLEEEFDDPLVDCDISVNGNHIDIDCTTTISLPPCTVNVSLSGGGTFSETAYDVTATIITTATGGAECAAFADPCTTTVRSVGQWQSAAGCAAAGDRISAASFVSQAFRGTGVLR